MVVDLGELYDFATEGGAAAAAELGIEYDPAADFTPGDGDPKLNGAPKTYRAKPPEIPKPKPPYPVIAPGPTPPGPGVGGRPANPTTAPPSPAIHLDPNLANICMGAIALILLLAFEPIRLLLRAILGETTGKGAGAGGWVDQQITNGWNFLAAYFNGLTGSLDPVIAGLFVPLQNITNSVMATLETTANKLKDITTVQIPNAAIWAATAAQIAIQQLRNDAWGLYLYGVQHTQDAIADALTQAFDATQGAVHWTQNGFFQIYFNIERWVNGIEQGLKTDLANLGTWAYNTANGIASWAQTEIAQTQAQATDEANQAYYRARTDQNTATQYALQPLWQPTATAVNQTTTSLVAEHPEEAPGLNLLSVATPVSTAGAVASLAVAVKSLSKVANDCALPNCNTKNNFARGIKGLGNLIGSGALLAFLVEAARDPEGMAHDVESTMGAFGQDVIHYVRDLV